MDRQIEKFRITERTQVILYASLVMLLICFLSATITYFSFWDHEPSSHNAALLVSAATPSLVALPFLYLSVSRYLELVKLSKELKLKEKDLAEIIDIIPDIVSRADASRRLTSVNQKYCEILGHDRDYLIGRDFTELIHTQSLETADRSINQLTPEHPVGSSKQLHITDGREYWVYWTNLVRYNLDGEPTEILSVGKDITELHRAQEEIEAQAVKLEETNKSLKKANNELEQFTSVASHDLQEPLRKIGFFAETLADALKEKDENTVQYALKVLSNAANRGRTQVSDLLNLSKTSNQPLDSSWIELSAILDSVISDLSQLMQRTQTKLFRSNDAFMIMGNQQLTNMILFNLIRNAINFAHPERTPEIQISFSRNKADKYILAIKDNGIGFENKYRSDIFKAFQRLHSTSEFEGNGMGLAIVSKASERQNWQVFADGKLDEGATFSIAIPANTVKEPVTIAK